MRRAAHHTNLERSTPSNAVPTGLASGSGEQVRAPGTYAPRWADTRLKTLKEAAFHTRVSPRTFLKMFAPQLHPIRPLSGSRGRCKLLFDRHEVDRLIDKMSGVTTAIDTNRDDLEFVKAQMEKRLE